jgi:NAD(P)-dependent dehydrogenase (short-subunit alcohol dehydrogenase family)
MKIVMVTGANSGIGFETAKALASGGNRVVMVCRNRDKAEIAKKKIIESTGNPEIEIMTGDLGSQEAVSKIGNAFRDKYEVLDILINNAGMIPGERKETVDGIEQALAVNHLAPFLLTNILIQPLMLADHARVITVSSEAHKAGSFDPDNLQLKYGYNSLKAYANSKLFNIMFTRSLAELLEKSSVTAYSLHPGTVRTNIHAGGGSQSIFSFLLKLGRPFMKSPKRGAGTSIYLATEPGIETLSGNYFVDKKVTKPLETAYDSEKCRHLWEISETLTIKWDKTKIQL